MDMMASVLCLYSLNPNIWQAEKSFNKLSAICLHALGLAMFEKLWDSLLFCHSKHVDGFESAKTLWIYQTLVTFHQGLNKNQLEISLKENILYTNNTVLRMSQISTSSFNSTYKQQIYVMLLSQKRYD